MPKGREKEKERDGADRKTKGGIGRYERYRDTESDNDVERGRDRSRQLVRESVRNKVRVTNKRVR